MTARRSICLLALFALLVISCGSSSKKSQSPSTVPKQRPQITVDATEYSFTLPAQIPSGWVDVTLRDRGKEPHQVAFVRLGSMTFDAFKKAAAATDLKSLPSDTVFVGGPNNVDPGGSVTATVHFEPGAYAVACFIPAADGKAHAAHGMVAQTTVATTPQSVDTAPTVDGGSITLSEFTFLPSNDFKGQGMVEIKNGGVQVHELILVKEAPGKTLNDVKSFFLSQSPTGPPPFTDMGGVVGVGPQQVVYQKMALTPGKYAMACFFPDPTKGNIPHALEGMLKEITIS